jgi:hypothetical protein
MGVDEEAEAGPLNGGLIWYCMRPRVGSSGHQKQRQRQMTASGAATGTSTTPAAWPAPATCRSCRWTRASSTRRGLVRPQSPIYFDPENIVELAIEGGCNAVASTLGVLGSVARRYAHKIPFLVKINHNEMLTYPTIYDQTLFARVEQAFDMGAVAVGATIYFGSAESAAARSWRSATPSSRPTSWAWSRCCGPTCATGLQEGRRRLSRSRRPHRPGQPPGRHHRGRHRQAEAGREQRGLHRHRLRQDPSAGLRS